MREPSGSSSTPPADRTRAGPGSGSRRISRPPWPARCRSSWRAGSTPPMSAAPLRDARRDRRRLRIGHGAPAGRRPAQDEGPAPRRALRQAGPCRADRPARTSRSARRPSPPGLLAADAAGRWGVEREFGGRYVPETLMAALEQLEAAYAALRHDPVFWSELRELLARYAGRPTALYRADRLAYEVLERAVAARPDRPAPSAPPPPVPQARGSRPHRCPQDQQRARPGAPDPPARQGPRHRRDRRRPARRRDRDSLCAARPALRRLHGRGRHRAPAAERPPDAGARCRGPPGHLRHRDAQGRGQRRDARLGDERRDDPLRPRLGDGPASVPDDRPRPPAPDRRRGGGPAHRRRGPAAGPRPGLRRRRLERDRAARSVHRRAVACGWPSPRQRGRGSRPAATPPRSPAARRASSTARAR